MKQQFFQIVNIIAFLSILITINTLGTQCNNYIGDSYFTLLPLKHEIDYNYTMPDGSTVYWNFCKFLDKKCDVDSRNAYAISENLEKKECTKLTADQTFGDFEEKLIDEEEPSQGVSLTINHGDNYDATGGKKYFVEFIIKCEEHTQEQETELEEKLEKTEKQNILHEALFNVTSVVIEENKYIITGSSYYGCPIFQMSKIWEYLGKNKLLFGLILLCFGTLECFFGYRLLRPTLFIIGYITGFGILVMILGEFIIGPDTEVAVIWIILVITVLFGALLGYLTMSAKKFGFFCLGFWMGTVIAFMLNNAILHKMENDYILWVTILTLGGIAGFASCVIHQHIVILATGSVGAYAIVRPFGWIADGFPNEFTLVEQFRHGTIKEIPPEFYLYFALIVLIAAIGIRYQYQFYYSQENTLRDSEYDLNKNSDENSSEEEEGDEENTKSKGRKSQKKGGAMVQELQDLSGLSKLKSKKSSNNESLQEKLIKKKGQQELDKINNKAKSKINSTVKQIDQEKKSAVNKINKFKKKQEDLFNLNEDEDNNIKINNNQTKKNKFQKKQIVVSTPSDSGSDY